MDETVRTLLLLRHAQTVDAAPGAHDHDRMLTPHGEQQAREVGDHLRDQGLSVDAVLCSDAVRARRTCELLGLGADVTIEVSNAFYNAGSDTLLEAISTLPAEVGTALVVGHAPGVPGVAYELTDPHTSHPDAFAAIESRFPPATLARLELTGPWSELAEARLVSARLTR